VNGGMPDPRQAAISRRNGDSEMYYAIVGEAAEPGWAKGVRSHLDSKSRLMSRWDSSETPGRTSWKNRRRIGEAQSAKV
jgi:hypothetical protein